MSETPKPINTTPEGRSEGPGAFRDKRIEAPPMKIDKDSKMDLDDVAAGHPVAMRELAELRERCGCICNHCQGHLPAPGVAQEPEGKDIETDPGRCCEEGYFGQDHPCRKGKPPEGKPSERAPLQCPDCGSAECVGDCPYNADLEEALAEKPAEQNFDRRAFEALIKSVCNPVPIASTDKGRRIRLEFLCAPIEDAIRMAYADGARSLKPSPSQERK